MNENTSRILVELTRRPLTYGDLAVALKIPLVNVTASVNSLHGQGLVFKLGHARNGSCAAIQWQATAAGKARAALGAAENNTWEGP